MAWGFAAILAGVLVGWITTSLLALRELDRLRRISERAAINWTHERKELLDRIMYLADKPWESPPLPAEAIEPEEEWEPDALDAPLGEASEWTEMLYDVPMTPLPPVNRV